ncbi:MAG TPA: bifunctional succinylornithine transaminase/acetylornithine transaminase [Deltaproteobacteria bacterium]|nr:bifunctional succinylornithine transaminase/acetylornithine transaminase [Deltaproteobacteria bacterium]
MENKTVNRSDFDHFMVPNYAPMSFIPVRGEGSRIWDQQGQERIDLTGGIAVTSLGHCHPALVKALQEQAQKLWHISNIYTNEPALRLARKLCEATFAERVFFANSGAEANEACLKLVRRYAHNTVGADKDEIIATFNGFHGRTLFTVSVGGQPKYAEGFGPKPEGINHVPYNDSDALRTAVSEKTCAIMVEPIQGEGGVLPAKQEFLQAARDLCDQCGALLIFDEVQSGMGRSGHLFAYQHYGVTPDVLSSAKSLGGGFPIGAMLTTAKVAEHFSVGTHGTTYGGNLLASVVAEAVLDVVNQHDVLEGIKQRQEWFESRLKQIGERYGIFKEIRGLGLLLGCVMSDSWAGKAGEVMKAAHDEGVMVLVAGLDVLRLAPSLVITEKEVKQGLDSLEKAISKLASQSKAA